MAEKTAIEWTATHHPDGTVTPGATWTPIRAKGDLGKWFCQRVSPGCDHCYASTFNHRQQGQLYGELDPERAKALVASGDIYLDPVAVQKPLHWRAPRRVFVSSMTDLFGEWMFDGWLMGLLTVMVRTPHIYQILTKRPTRMADFFAKWADLSGESDDPVLLRDRRPAAVREAHPSGRGHLFADYLETLGEPPEGAVYPTFDWMEGPRWWPTILPQIWLGTSVELDRYSWRAKVVAGIPAVVHFVSAEPLLGPLPSLDMVGLEWVIVGGESGIGHRPMETSWATDLRDRANAAGVAFHFKQWGGRTPKAGGRLLDGRFWDEFPGGAA